MGLMDRLKNAVFEEEGGEVRQPQNGVKPTTAVPPPNFRPAGSAQQPHYHAPVSTIPVDPTFLDRIQKVAEAAPQRSYTEFRGFFEAMNLPDERSRYMAALAASHHKGFPAEEVVRGLDVILKAIDDHRAQFQRSVPDQMEKTVGARRREISSIDEQVAQKRQHIDALNREIYVLTAERQTKESDIVSEERKIKDTEEKVIAAVESVRAQYLAERDRVASYSGVGQSARTS